MSQPPVRLVRFNDRFFSWISLPGRLP